MIGFSCTNCGYTFSVQDDYSGKRIKCPKCGFVGLVIDDSGRIKITCKNCGNENNVSEMLAGKEIQCPKCNNPVEVPSIEKGPAETDDKIIIEKSPETPDKSETTEHKTIIIISAIAAVIVTVLIIMAAVIPLYKSKKARKTQAPPSRQQIDRTQQTKQNTQDSDEKPLTLIDALKWNKSATIVCLVAIPCFILFFYWIYRCPKCNKTWAMKNISSIHSFGGSKEYECKYCGYIKKMH